MNITGMTGSTGVSLAWPGWQQEGEGESEHNKNNWQHWCDNLNDWKPSCANAVPGQGGDCKKARARVSDTLNDWKPWCANAVPGQGGDCKKARVRVSMA